MTHLLEAIPWPEALMFWLPAFVLGIVADRLYLAQKQRASRSAP